MSSGSNPSSRRGGAQEEFTEHFIKTLHKKLQDPSLLQTCPPPPLELFKHTDKNSLTVGGRGNGPLSAASAYGAPPGAYKLLSSDYAYLDDPAPEHKGRRGNAATGSGWAGAGTNAWLEEEDSEAGLPAPPLAMQQTRFLGNARLVLIKLRQQLEEVCVGAVRSMEASIVPADRAGLGGPVLPSALSRRPSMAASAATAAAAAAAAAGAATPGALTQRSLAEGSPLGGSSLAGERDAPGLSVGGVMGRLPVGLAEEVAENVRTKLCAAFEDCLSDTMDQLWGALQYAGSKHAMVDRLKQAMQQREAEMDAMAAKKTEELMVQLRALRKQKDESEEQAEKERSRLTSLLVASSQRIEFLDRDVSNLRGQLEVERSSASAKLEAQRASYEAALRGRDEALQALRDDTVARLEEARALSAGLHAQLRQKQDESERHCTRAGEQVALLEAAFARRDALVRELQETTSQLEDYRRLVAMPAALPLPDWLKGLRETDDMPLTPLVGGPLTLQYGTGRAFMAAARTAGLHAVCSDLRKLLPSELPLPEGWPPEGAGGEDALGLGPRQAGKEGEEDEDEEEDESRAVSRSTTPFPASEHGSMAIGRGLYPATLPPTWLRFLRAPLGDPLEAPRLMATLASMAAKKWAADGEARLRGLPPPDLHAFVYRQVLEENPCAAEADDVVVCLVQSLRAHARKLQRAATWLQLLQITGTVIPPDGLAFYLELFQLLLASSDSHPTNVKDKRDGTVWVAPAKWKAILMGRAAQAFDTTHKAMMLKQVASARIDTVRGSASFGLSDLDSLLAAVMHVWLLQRQAALDALAAAWQDAEPLGGGVLALTMDVDDLTRVAGSALGGRDQLPDARGALLDLYGDTVQHARAAQAAARVRWSGLTVAALGAALASAGLLPPRPLSDKGTREGARLAAAGGHILRIADALITEMKGMVGFGGNEAFEALEAKAKGLRALLQPGGGGGGGEGADAAQAKEREERRVADGWGALEEVVAALLAARKEFRAFEAEVVLVERDNAVRAALKQHRQSGDGSKSRPGSAGNRLGSRSQRASRKSTAGLDSGAASALASAAGSLQRARSSVSSVGACGGGGGSPSRPMSGRAGSSRLRRPSSGVEGVLPRDLRAALASGRWSSSDEDEADGEAGGDGDGGLPPVLQLRGPANRRRGAGGGGLHVSGEDGARHDGPTPPMSPGMMQALMSSGGEGEAVGDVLYGEELLGEVDEGEEGDGEAGVGGGYSSGSRRAAAAAVKRLERLERKYGRLRGRFDEVMRALQVVYATGGGNGDGAGGGGGGGGGVGLPPPEALAQLSPAVRLRLVAELLATLHRECEESVWPHLDEAALAALAGRGVAQQQQQPSVGIARRRVGSRPASASVVASGGRPMSASRAFGDGAGGAGEPGAAAGAEPPETEDGSVPTSVASQHGSKAEAEQLELEQQQQQQQQAAAEVGALPEVLQQVVGRLHAHAGQVGQTMAMAALGAAALAQALEDLEASWAEQQQRGGPSPGRRSRSVASLWLGGGVLGEGAPGRWDTGLVSPLSPGAVGPAGNGPQQGGRMTGSRLSTGSGMGDGSYLGGAAAGAAVMLLRRPSSASRGPGGLGMPMGGSRRPTSAGTGGPASHRSTSAMGEPGDQLQQQYVEQDGDQLGGDDPGVGLAVPRDSDPRDTVKLDALRALHVAAEVQAAGGDARALYDAVQHVVRLMGGQPKLTATGRIIEFFPRRLPKDWRHPLLRSSLMRLYVFVTGLLLQQQERSVLLQEATADLMQRKAALDAAANHLAAKASSLHGAQAAMGVQLASIAACVAHGSVMATAVEELKIAGDALRQVLWKAPHEPASGLGGAGGPGGGGSECYSVPRLEWHMALEATKVMTGALERMQGGAMALAQLTAAKVEAGQGKATGGGTGAGHAPAQPAPGAVVLPSGDHVLVVHVHHHTHPQGTGALGTQGGPGAAAPHSSCSAPGDAVKFVVELPTAAQGGSGGGAVLPVVRSEYSESSEETSRHSAAPGEAVPQYPDVPTPGVTPESSAIYASHRSPEYSLQMALHRAAQSWSDDPSALPPGEALIHLSNAMLRRSAMGPHQGMRARPPARGSGSPQRGGRPASAAADALGPLPAHYERRPMTARAFVEGVMRDARQQQLDRLYGSAGPMPLGGVPEVDGLAAVDAHEAAALAEQALLLVSRQPQPSTALEVLMQEAEVAASAQAAEAAAAEMAAAFPGADGLDAAGPEAGTVHFATGREAQALGGMHDTPAQAGSVRAGSPGRPASGRSTGERQGQGRGRSRLYSSGRALPRGGAGAAPPPGAAGGDTGRLAAGITGTRLAVLPPVGYMGAPLPIPASGRPGTADAPDAGAGAGVGGNGAAAASGVQGRSGGSAAAAAAVATGLARLAGEADLGQPATGLGYYPGTQVDAMGRVTDWRLSLLAPLAQPPSRRASPPRQQAMGPPHGK